MAGRFGAAGSQAFKTAFSDLTQAYFAGNAHCRLRMILSNEYTSTKVLLSRCCAVSHATRLVCQRHTDGSYHAPVSCSAASIQLTPIQNSFTMGVSVVGRLVCCAITIQQCWQHRQIAAVQHSLHFLALKRTDRAQGVGACDS